MVYIVLWIFYFYLIIYFRGDINILYLIYYDIFDIWRYINDVLHIST